VSYIRIVPRNDDVVWYLSVEQTEADGVTTIAAEGRISERTSRDLQRILDAAAQSSGPGVILDLTGVDYISSAGLRTLERTAGRLGADGRALVLCGPQDEVKAALALAGCIPHLAIEQSRDSAIERLRKNR
jgi:anti-anti-sigma factor